MASAFWFSALAARFALETRFVVRPKSVISWRYHGSRSSTLVEDRIVQRTGRDARAGIGIDRRQVNRRGRPQIRSNFSRDLD